MRQSSLSTSWIFIWSCLLYLQVSEHIFIIFMFPVHGIYLCVWIQRHPGLATIALAVFIGDVVRLLILIRFFPGCLRFEAFVVIALKISQIASRPVYSQRLRDEAAIASFRDAISRIQNERKKVMTVPIGEDVATGPPSTGIDGRCGVTETGT